MANPTHSIPAEKLECSYKFIAVYPEIERKGAKIPYASFDAHMFSYLAQDRTMDLQLPREEREGFLDKYKTPPFVPYDPVVKEYVTIPDSLLKNTGDLLPYLELSLAMQKGVKSNPTSMGRARRPKG